MEESEEIIKKAKQKMQPMLKSVLNFNSVFNPNYKELNQILFAMSVIDRNFFYKGEDVYQDTALEIGEKQTISQPSTVARMLLLLELKKGDSVLEVGTGSGWNASLISYLIFPGHITTVEIYNSLTESAENNFASLRGSLKIKKPELYEKTEKINFFTENIFDKKKAWKRSYDKIILTAGITSDDEEKIKSLAQSLLKQNGILVCPYKKGPILVLKKKGKIIASKTSEEYQFVPLR